ncbi:MAG: DUF1972 domain-containing protein [Bacilli bacterium]|nr:DUF1972 domain-containing protein [Bacilli bacterium]
MKNIIIIGARGYEKNYGGWETFVTNLINNYDDKDTKFYVPELNHNKKNRNIEVRNGVTCPQIYVPKQGAMTMFTFAFKATLYFKKYIKKNNLKNVIMYVVGYRVGPLFTFIHKKLNKMGVKIVINPDGIEWKREKWNFLIKQYLKLSERTMINASDYVVCDSKNIESFIKDRYKKKADKTTFIAYGAYLKDIKDIDKKTKEFMDKNNIENRDYYLIVGRFVPENNYELIIREYMKSDTTKSLVIVSNVERNKFYEKLKIRTGFENDKRIKFVGPVYDQEILVRLRKNAKAYIHGHSAGGTNPSLLEALSITDVNLLYDAVYNREVGEDAALYFNDEEGSLCKQINTIEKFKAKEQNEYGKRAKQRIKDEYTWEIVVKKYKKLFNKLLGLKK